MLCILVEVLFLLQPLSQFVQHEANPKTKKIRNAENIQAWQSILGIWQFVGCWVIIFSPVSIVW
jgi:hypothetical protein